MKKLINKLLVALKIKKPFIWTPPEIELRKLEKAYSKYYSPTIECYNQFAKNREFEIELDFVDLDEKKCKNQFKITLNPDNLPGLKFKIIIPNILNVGGVKYKESYGLDKDLVLVNSTSKLFIPEDSVYEFETKFPTKPQVLEGRFSCFKSLNQYSKGAYYRLLVPIKDKDMVFPTSILDYKENHMKFDISSWDRQMTLMGIPFMTTMGMYAELTIKNHKFHFYAIEQINSQIIDSIDKIELKDFNEYSYAIRLCFAFLSGKFYRDETIIFASEDANLSKIDYYEYKIEQPSIISENQIINPIFFFGQYSKKDKETQESWKKYHNMFDTSIFSLMCEKVIDSSEFKRSLELIVNASNISDPVQKGALYSVSIETITELLKSESDNGFNPIQEKPIWKAFYKDLKESLDKIKSNIDEDGYTILSRNIENLNTPTFRDKLKKAYSKVGVELGDDELKVLNQRNRYLHGGQPDDKNWFTLSNLNALKLHYLLGILILKYFNYSGHYINISGWYMLHNREAKKLMEQFDFEELKETISKVQTKKLETIEQIKRARQVLENFEKFSVTALTIDGLIKII